MKKLRFLAYLPLLLALSGCVVVSMFPFYQEADLVSLPELTGDWRKVNPGDPEKNETWQFKKWDDKGWWFKAADATGKQTFTAEVHAFRLKETLFLDMAVAAGEENSDQLIRPHFLFKVTQTKPTLKWALLSEEWVKKVLAKDPKALRHQINRKEDGAPDDDLILTAETKDLREFLLKHLDEPDAFNEIDELQRLKP